MIVAMSQKSSRIQTKTDCQLNLERTATKKRRSLKMSRIMMQKITRWKRQI